MLDINHLRNNLKDVQDNLKKRGFVLDAKQFNSLDSERKLLQTKRNLFKKNQISLLKKYLLREIKRQENKNLKMLKKFQVN